MKLALSGNHTLISVVLMLQVQTEFAGGFDKCIVVFSVTYYLHVAVK